MGEDHTGINDRWNGHQYSRCHSGTWNGTSTSGLKDIVHGQGLAALTPVIVEASHKGNHFKFAKIARIFGGVTAEDLAGKLRSLLKDIELSCTLSDLGLSEEDIPWMAENCMKVSAASIQNNPVVFTQEEIAEIYRKAM